MFLKNLSQQELAENLKPAFTQFYAQLTDEQKQQVSYAKVVEDSYGLLHGKQFLTKSIAAADTTQLYLQKMTAVSISPCIMAVGMVIADTFAVVFQILGINEEESRAATRVILEELGQDTIRGIQATLHDFNAADSLIEKAKLMWKIISQVYNVLGVSGIIKAIKDSFEWYDWLITGVTIAAQLTAWFATDGVALIAELALETAYIAQFTEDVVKALSACA